MGGGTGNPSSYHIDAHEWPTWFTVLIHFLNISLFLCFRLPYCCWAAHVGFSYYARCDSKKMYVGSSENLRVSQLFLFIMRSLRVLLHHYHKLADKNALKAVIGNSSRVWCPTAHGCEYLQKAIAFFGQTWAPSLYIRKLLFGRVSRSHRWTLTLRLLFLDGAGNSTK